jgi:hypothetical protein
MKKKYKIMETKTTQELLDILSNPAKSAQHAAALAELMHSTRKIPDDYTDVSMRGGIRPSRPSL